MHREGSCSSAQVVCRYRLLGAVYVPFSSPVFLYKGFCAHACVMPLSLERRTGRGREEKRRRGGCKREEFVMGDRGAPSGRPWLASHRQHPR